MAENNSNIDTNKRLFIGIVTMLGMSAMQHLGKIVNPETGKAAVDLDAASATIDTLDMLAAKTKGNLEADEERLLRDTLSSLKMNFVETKAEMQNAEGRMQNEKQQDTTAKRPEDTAAAKPEPPTQEKSEPQPKAEQGNNPKFHKSYS